MKHKLYEYYKATATIGGVINMRKAGEVLGLSKNWVINLTKQLVLDNKLDVQMIDTLIGGFPVFEKRRVIITGG